LCSEPFDYKPNGYTVDRRQKSNITRVAVASQLVTTIIFLECQHKENLSKFSQLLKNWLFLSKGLRKIRDWLGMEIFVSTYMRPRYSPCLSSVVTSWKAKIRLFCNLMLELSISFYKQAKKFEGHSQV
jgi:hypothetical protein